MSKKTIDVENRGTWCAGCGVTGLFESLLWLAGGLMAFIGVSFVRGAIDEREPEAARMGAWMFGGLSGGLLLLAALVRWARRR